MDGEARVWGIGDLNRRAGRAVVMEFRGQVWLAGELTRLDERRGNRWLELVEREGGRDGRDAHLEAFCSATKWARLERKLAEAAIELRPGQRLVIVGTLDVGDRGKLTLTVDDVDVAALVGDRLRARQVLVQRLVDDDLFDANRRLPLHPLPLRVGLVASAGSDGHRDFVRQLESSGFAFDVTLRAVQVEGPTAPRAIKAALAMFGADDVDVAVIVRGGGAKASLDVFDSPMVAHAIATAIVPVWTGIGHTGDRAVADEVAHRCLATPTAAGQALVATVAEAWAQLVGKVGRIARVVDARTTRTSVDVDRHRRAVAGLARSQLALLDQVQARTSGDLWRAAASCTDAARARLERDVHDIGVKGGVELRDAGRGLAGLALEAGRAAGQVTAGSADDLATTASTVSTSAARLLRGATGPVDRALAVLTASRLDAMLDRQSEQVMSRRAVLGAYDPSRQLARGWTLTYAADGRLVRSAADLAAGAVLVTTFVDGTAASTVTRVTRKTPPHE